MNTNPKFAERLTILNELGQGILQRLHQLKKIYNGPQRPAFINDPQYSKVIAILTKKFPDFDPSVEKTPGYELLTGKAKAFYEELEPHYLVLVDAHDYKEAALPVLNEVASGTLELKLDENPTLTVAFLELFRIYVQINIMISTIEERRLILATFYKLYYFIKCINEPSYSKVANYVISFENPIKSMQEEFKSLSTSLGKALINFITLFNKLRSVPILRKEGAINITLKPEDMQKPVTDKFHFQMPYSSQIYVWLSYGFLLCPENLALPGALDLCQVVLRDGYVAPVYRSTIFPIHQEYDNLFNNYKSKNLNLTKQKKAVKDVFGEASIRAAIASHKQRRVFLRQELNSLYHLFVDKPGLFGPKLQLLLCALASSKEEIFWYFRHLRSVLNKTLKKITEEEIRDNRISELIYLNNQFLLLLRKYKKVVQQYYLEYLRGPDLSKLNELVDSNFLNLVGPGMAAIARSVVDACQAANPDDLNRNYDYRVLRLNWFRAESAFSSVQTSVTYTKIREAVDRFNLVVNHTRFIDDLEGLIDQYVSLKGLYYWRDLVYDAFDKAIKDGPNQPLHVLGFITLLGDFPSNSTVYTGDEKEEIGREVVAQAEKFITDAVGRVGSLLNEVAKQYIIFDSGLSDVNAAYPLLSKKKEYKPTKDFAPPETPGEESTHKRRPELERLRLYERNAWQLCAILNNVESIVVYDSKFYPREFLRDKLTEILRKFIRSIGVTEIKDEKQHPERVLQRPSVLEKQLNAYLSVIHLVENFVDLDISELVRDVLLTEIWIPPTGKSNTFDWVSAEEHEFKYETSTTGPKLIGNIVTWYQELVAKRLQAPGICYSTNRQGFVSRTGLAFRAEFYADLDELKALCRIVGPYGIKLIDREALKFILSNASSFKDALSHNKQALEELAAGYHNENSCNEALRKFKDIDNVVTRSIAIGNALYFRDTLHEALRQTLEEKTPFIFNTINTMHHQTKPNTYMTPELLPVDALAHEAGIAIRTADQPLKKYLSRAFVTNDSALINLLPYLFAASFTSAAWRDAQYKPLIEAHNNNQHAVARTIDALTVGLKAVATTDRDEREIVQLQRIFVEVSSVILLRLARSTKKDEKTYPIDLSSVITFMDRFIQESTVLTQDVLEANMPYTLLRNHWKSIFAPKVTKKAQEVSAVDVF